MNNSTGPVTAPNAQLTGRGRRRRLVYRSRRTERQRSVGTVDIVVSDERGQNSLQMPSIQDQEPIETLRARRSYKPLRDTIRLRCAKWRPDDLDGLRRAHVLGHENVLKRLLVHAGAFNLGLWMRTLFGVGRLDKLECEA